MLFINLLIFVTVCIGIFFSSRYVVKSIIKIDEYFHLRDFVVGALVIGILTSVPELFVGIFSALTDVSSLSLGNILGANFLLLTWAVGIMVLVGKRIKVETAIERGTIFVIALLTILPLILFLDQELSRIDGFILISAFTIYLIRILIKRKKFKLYGNEKVSKREVHKDIIIFIVSLIILIASARLIVYSATQIAIDLAFPPIVIGLLIVALGTTIPELTFGVSSVRRGHATMGLGDNLGSLAFNSTFILGVTSIISPIRAPFSSFIISSIFIIISLLTFLIFARTGKQITRKEGIILIFVYILFIIANIFLGKK